jgi:hypothetical protein
MKITVPCLFVLVMLLVVAVPVCQAAPASSAAPATSALLAQAAPAKPAAPATSAAAAESAESEPYDTLQAMHVFVCEMGEGVTEEQVDAMAQQKLKALRQLPGAEKAEVHVLWPAVVSNMGKTDFWIVWTLPSFSDWGKLWDAYNDATALARGDDATEGKVNCPESMLWESHEIVLPK